MKRAAITSRLTCGKLPSALRALEDSTAAESRLAVVHLCFVLSVGIGGLCDPFGSVGKLMTCGVQAIAYHSKLDRHVIMNIALTEGFER